MLKGVGRKWKRQPGCDCGVRPGCHSSAKIRSGLLQCKCTIMAERSVSTHVKLQEGRSQPLASCRGRRSHRSIPGTNETSRLLLLGNYITTLRQCISLLPSPAGNIALVEGHCCRFCVDFGVFFPAVAAKAWDEQDARTAGIFSRTYWRENGEDESRRTSGRSATFSGATSLRPWPEISPRFQCTDHQTHGSAACRALGRQRGDLGVRNTITIPQEASAVADVGQTDAWGWQASENAARTCAASCVV